MMEKLEEEFHIQPYDIQMNAIKNEKGFEIIVTYGERFAHRSEQFMTFQSIKKRDEIVNKFIRKTGETCKQVLIDDYFRKMTP